MVQQLTDKDFQKETSTGVTVTDFWATWCPPCRMQAPIIEETAKALDGKVKFTKMDVDANPETPAQFGIMSIPTLIIKKDGQVVNKLVGLHSKNQLEHVLAQYTD